MNLIARARTLARVAVVVLVGLVGVVPSGRHVRTGPAPAPVPAPAAAAAPAAFDSVEDVQRPRLDSTVKPSAFGDRTAAAPEVAPTRTARRNGRVRRYAPPPPTPPVPAAAPTRPRAALVRPYVLEAERHRAQRRADRTRLGVAVLIDIAQQTAGAGR